MEYFAISDLELRQFHMAGLVAGGGDSVAPVIDTIRARKISYPVVAKKPTDNNARRGTGLSNCNVCANHNIICQRKDRRCTFTQRPAPAIA